MEINETTLEAIAKGAESQEGIRLALEAVSESLDRNTSAMSGIDGYFKSMVRKQEDEDEEKKREDEEEKMYKKIKKMIDDSVAEVRKQIKEEAAKLPKSPDSGETQEPIQGQQKEKDEEEEEKKSIVKQKKEEEYEEEKKQNKDKEEYEEEKKQKDEKYPELKKSFDEAVEEAANKKAEGILRKQGWKKVQGGQRRFGVDDLEKVEKIMKGEAAPDYNDLKKMSYGQLKALQMKWEQEEATQRFPV